MKQLLSLDRISLVELISVSVLITFVFFIVLSSGLANSLFFVAVLIAFLMIGHKLVKSANKRSKNY